MNFMPRSCLLFSFPSVTAWRRGLICLLLFAVLGVHAQISSTIQLKGTPHEEVQKAMSQRKWDRALELVDAYLQERPRDPQMRFWRARMLEQLQRFDEAFMVYEELAQDYPELPEVQNNLGVMYAAKGNLDMAKYAFEQALRNDPTYATAYENMGDILLHLARQSYAKSVQLDPSSAQSVQQKLLSLNPVLQLTLSIHK
jgi:tetratricopeptide (TPR) repeat protein